MARNKDRHFSEGDGLNARDLGHSIPEAEDRLPAWAQRREEAADQETTDAEKADTDPVEDEIPPESGEDAAEEDYDFISSTSQCR